ncbi:GntR family transcriptional regulator [Actinomadura sp. DC4]|uniref:GntR family transcriptional regulator n=1 Tax=Actinomadura sp. DC4 TaxID=3055069 RepID=UPI0025B0BC69|nr:GntR family transcriptional regulator [Actinomadura sp. DC4]MDN3360166.1 GntR family transcriptional regulator [Actinomadura sp. DC4]
MFQFRLDGSTGVPPYLQIVQQVRQGLLLGYLHPGDQLPTVKDVVSHLAINPNTVVKAYRQLENDGLVSARPGQGTFVTGSVEPVAAGPYAKLRRSLEQWVREAYDAGLDDEMVTAMFATIRHELRAEGVA